MKTIAQKMDEALELSRVAAQGFGIYKKLQKDGALAADIQEFHDTAFKSGAAAAGLTLMISSLERRAARVKGLEIETALKDILGEPEAEQKPLADRNGKAIH